MIFHGDIIYRVLQLVFVINLPFFIKAQEKGSSAEELANKLSNPVASLISVPFQNNVDYGMELTGSKCTGNFQPVVPITLT